MRTRLKELIYSQILRSRRNVFLRNDFENISEDYDQVGRALRELTKETSLVKIGYGLYAKARINPFTQQPMLAAKGGFNQVSKEALKRLGVDWQPPAESFGNQVPTNVSVLTSQRFNRKIAFKNSELEISRT